MKFKVTREVEEVRPVFHPVKVVLELTTPNDLFYLAAALNLGGAHIKKLSSYLAHHDFEKPRSNYDLWEALDCMVCSWVEECRQLGVDPITTTKE